MGRDARGHRHLVVRAAGWADGPPTHARAVRDRSCPRASARAICSPTLSMLVGAGMIGASFVVLRSRQPEIRSVPGRDRPGGDRLASTMRPCASTRSRAAALIGGECARGPRALPAVPPPPRRIAWCRSRWRRHDARSASASSARAVAARGLQRSPALEPARPGITRRPRAHRSASRPRRPITRSHLDWVMSIPRGRSSGSSCSAASRARRRSPPSAPCCRPAACVVQRRRAPERHRSRVPAVLTCSPTGWHGKPASDVANPGRGATIVVTDFCRRARSRYA